MAKGVGIVNAIEEEHEADERPIDGGGSIPFGEQVIPIGFGIGGCHFGRFETGMFLMEPGGKATDILGVQRNGFDREIRAKVQLVM
jgi:hypothetical protein